MALYVFNIFSIEIDITVAKTSKNLNVKYTDSN